LLDVAKLDVVLHAVVTVSSVRLRPVLHDTGFR
jgi:hypothetical protein